MLSAAISDLIAAGWSEARIAKAVGCSQATINRIKRGKQKNVGYTTGTAIDALRAKHVVNVKGGAGEGPTPATEESTTS